ncbi:hypothetical protein H6758_05270 [Candidatus Nomurabacteria bacterium]|nr:hypothetical protein [Candidatus Nomurabacteria bacterium]
MSEFEVMIYFIAGCVVSSVVHFMPTRKWNIDPRLALVMGAVTFFVSSICFHAFSPTINLWLFTRATLTACALTLVTSPFLKLINITQTHRS